MWVWVEVSMLSLLAVATLTDLRKREVPDWIPLVLLGLAIVAAVLGWTETTGWQLAAGMTIGFFLPAVLFYLGGLGGGDVKLLAAIGALLGPWGWVQAMVWVGLMGGVLALVSLMRRQRAYAYVPAIAAGVTIHCLFGLEWLLG